MNRPRHLGGCWTVLSLFGACVTPQADIARPTDLPERIWLQTPTESFNKAWYVALRDGRIWLKPNPDSSPFRGDWQLLGQSGLPEGCGLVHEPLPGAIAQLSIDGVHLMALSRDGRFYRAENAMQDLRNWVQWDDRWGWPAGMGSGLTVEFSASRGWSVGDSNQLDVEYYEDIRGDRHPVRMGVAHLYRLSEEGRHIHYNDWWLPNDWSRETCGPARGTLVMANLRVSGSTLFAVGEGGELYTRLWDFDTSGESDLLTYSYVNTTPDDNIRALPAEAWRRQPPAPGRVTSTIAIFQTGQGNAARTLRIAGEQAGVGGTFEKALDDEEWRFVATTGEVSGPFLDDLPPPAPTAPDDHALLGTLQRQNAAVRLSLVVRDFNLLCSPAQVELRVDDRPVTVQGAPLLLALHHVQAMVTAPRPRSYWQHGIPAQIRAALLVPAAIRAIDGDGARAAVHALLGEREVVNFQGTATPTALDLGEIPITTPFLVPLEEKGTLGQLFALTAQE